MKCKKRQQKERKSLDPFPSRRLTAIFPAIKAPQRQPIEKIPVMTDCLEEATAQTPSAVQVPNRAERRRRRGLEEREADRGELRFGR